MNGPMRTRKKGWIGIAVWMCLLSICLYWLTNFLYAGICTYAVREKNTLRYTALACPAWDINVSICPKFITLLFYETGLIDQPLIEAAYQHDVKALEICLRRGGDPNLDTGMHYTPMIAVAFGKTTGRVPCYELLLRYGADINGIWVGGHYTALMEELSMLDYTCDNKELYNDRREAIIYLQENGATITWEDSA